MKVKIVRYMTGYAIRYKKGLFSRWKIVRYGDFFPDFPERMAGKTIEFNEPKDAADFVLNVIYGTGRIIRPPKNYEPESPHIVGSTYLPN